MKSPPTQVPDDEAYDAAEKFIRDNARNLAPAEATQATR
jgi:hypothetical protein